MKFTLSSDFMFVLCVAIFYANILTVEGFFHSSRCIRRPRIERSHLTQLAGTEPRLVTVTNEDNGKSTEIEVGSPMSLAAVRTEMRLPYSCKAGWSNC